MHLDTRSSLCSGIVKENKHLSNDKRCLVFLFKIFNRALKKYILSEIKMSMWSPAMWDAVISRCLITPWTDISGASSCA